MRPRDARSVVALLVVLMGFGLWGAPAGAQQQRGDDARFAQSFTLPGVEFSKEQQAEIGKLREKYVPKLAELQRQRNGIHTDEQRRARRGAFQAARDAGKSAEESREAGEAAVQLTAEQRQTIADLQKRRTALLESIQQDLRGLLTAEQRTALQQRQRARSRNAGPRLRPTHADLKYGPHARNLMDVWLAKTDEPAPVLVSIHGGGFRGGNKSVAGDLLKACLDAGISVVAITYRLTDTAIAPAQFHDSARAIQFIRHNAKAWNIDPARIAATGGSAGAGISLWLGFHDELADPDNADPVLRESTRLTCMSVFNGQSSYDPRFIRKLIPENDTYAHSALALLFDVDMQKLDELPEEKYRLFELVSPITHLTRDDVPAQMIYATDFDTKITNHGIGIHHPRFGKALKEKMDALGIECQVHTNVGRGGQASQLTLEFVKKHFGMGDGETSPTE